MNNEDAFKIVLHSDDAFATYLERVGSESVKSTLQGMRMKLETQIAKWGDERLDWHRKATSLLVVVNVRIQEVIEWENDELAVYKELVEDILSKLQEKLDKYDYPLPDVNDLDAVDEWIEGVGL